MEKKKAPSTKRVPAPDEATILLKLIDGARQPLPAETEILVYVHGRDGENAVQPFTLHGSQSAKINVPFHDNLFDHYSVIASSSGYQQAGTFVDTKPEEPAEITLLLVKNNAKFTFPKWDALKQQRPAITEFLACDGDDANAKKQYDRIAVEHPAVLASLLNLATAMSLISLGGKTPLQYFRRILWDSTMAQDRFFGYADPALIPAVKNAAEARHFAAEPNCAEWHPGATCSFKQTDYQVANVQLTFHENDSEIIGGLKCVLAEPDIDYYKDLIAHGLGEVIPNKIKHQLTNPLVVYSLRYNNDGDSFDPGYVVV